MARLNFFKLIGMFGFMMTIFFAQFSFDIYIFTGTRLEPHDITNSEYVLMSVSYVSFSRQNFMHFMQPWQRQLANSEHAVRMALERALLYFTSTTVIFVSSDLNPCVERAPAQLFGNSERLVQVPCLAVIQDKDRPDGRRFPPLVKP